MTRVVVLAALFMVLGIAPVTRAPSAVAADNGLWSIFPTTNPSQLLARAYFQPFLRPGVTVRDSVTITNKTKATLHFAVYAADAFNTRDGGFALKHMHDPQHDIGRWAQLPVSSVTVHAHSKIDIPFTVTPPVDATPGDHSGGIVAENTEPIISRDGQLTIRQVYAVAARVYARVAGPIHEKLAITKLQVSTHRGAGALVGGGVTSSVDYTVVNTGNVRLHPTARLSVSPLVGPRHTVAALALPELLPGGSAVIHQDAPSVLPFGRLTAHLSVMSEAATVNASTSAWVVPWVLVAIVILLLVGIGFWRRRQRQLRRRPSPSGPRLVSAEPPLVGARGSHGA